MSAITCKFGGTSLADAKCIQEAVAIIKADPARRYVVVSAPGKRSPDDTKITDHLYQWHKTLQAGGDPASSRDAVRDRFLELARDLGVKFNIESLLDEIEAELPQYSTPDFMASRGEFLNGHLIAEVLGATYVEPAECIYFNTEGDLDPKTYDSLGECLKGDGLFVIPGFYGTRPDGKIATFSRGGSDITGAIVTRAAGCSLYENWTDVSGFLMADPRLVDNPHRIEKITYQELRELSYMGATVLHDEAIRPVRALNIPIHIRNSKSPDDSGTLIVPDRVSKYAVCGIAGRTGFSMVNITKAFMNKERGFGMKVFSVFFEHGVSWEHMPTGIDTISIIVRDDHLADKADQIIKGIKNAVDPDEISLRTGLAMIATVGVGMNHHIGVAARLCAAIANAGVNLEVIDQGSSEINIIIGVDEKDLAAAVKALYNEFKED